MGEKKEILDLLETIYEQKRKGISVDSENLKRDGFETSLIKQAIHWKLIDFSGVDYYLTDIGFNTLNQNKISRNTEQLKKIMDEMSKNIKKSGEITNNFSKYSKKQNKKMIKLTNWIKILTMMLGFLALVQIGLLIFQICINAQQSQIQNEFTEEMIKQGEENINILKNISETMSEISENKSLTWLWALISVLLIIVILICLKTKRNSNKK